MHRVHIDFETFSEVDLGKCGARIYAEHRSTEILCLAYCVDDGPVKLLRQDQLVMREAQELWDSAYANSPIFIAHNAGFEQAIWESICVKKYKFKPLPIERWQCTLAKAYAHGLPGKLEKVAKALNLKHQKDMAGNLVMKKLSKPRKPTKNNPATRWTRAAVPDDFEKLYRYCIDDVEVERELDHTLRDLSPYEQRVWQIDQRMNQRGICIDVPMVERAIEFSERHQEGLLEQFRMATGNVVDSPAQRAALLQWSKDNGFKLINTQAATIKAALARTNVPHDVRNALTILQSANKSSLAKYPAFLERQKNGIVRENLQYHGAHTGRWSGRGVQIQNLPRPSVEAGPCIDALLNLQYESFGLLYGNLATALSSILRPVIISRTGTMFMGGDYSQIESRVLAWLAGEETKLDLFRQGTDVYCKIAEWFYGYPVNKKDHPDQRQGGKVGDLGYGYQGGIAAGDNFAKIYGVDFAPLYPAVWATTTYDERKNAEYCYMLYLKTEREEYCTKEFGYVANVFKDRWRAAHPCTVQYWADLERTAIQSVSTGKPVTCRAVTWFTHKQFLHCKLPSGRILSYPYPKVEEGSRGKVTLSYRTEFQNKWIRITTYGGSLCENIVQAVARDLMVHAMVLMEDKYPWLFTVHDEAVAEVPIGYGSLEEFSEMMADLPPWGEGIPHVVGSWSGYRYVKT